MRKDGGRGGGLLTKVSAAVAGPFKEMGYPCHKKGHRVLKCKRNPGARIRVCQGLIFQHRDKVAVLNTSIEIEYGDSQSPEERAQSKSAD